MSTLANGQVWNSESSLGRKMRDSKEKIDEKMILSKCFYLRRFMNFSDEWLHNNSEIVSIKFSRILQIHLQFEVVGSELKKFCYQLEILKYCDIINFLSSRLIIGQTRTPEIINHHHFHSHSDIIARVSTNLTILANDRRFLTCHDF